MASARAKKSRPPKLPDFSAICSSPPKRPMVRISGTPGAISWSQSERNDAEPIDHCAGRLASSHDKSPHAELNEADRDLRERAFDRVARGLAAVTRLQSRDLLRLRAGRDGNRTLATQSRAHVDRAARSRDCPRSTLERERRSAGIVILHRRDLFERRPRARPGQDCGKSAHRFERRAVDRSTLARAAARASPSPRPDAPTETGPRAAASPIASSSRSNTVSMIAAPNPCAVSSASRSAILSLPCATVGRSMRPTGAFDWRSSTRTRLESRIGLSGWSFNGLSCRGTDPTKRCPR